RDGRAGNRPAPVEGGSTREGSAVEAAAESTDCQEPTAVVQVGFRTGQNQLPPTQDIRAQVSLDLESAGVGWWRGAS
ncbi:hypothetical protein MELA_01545, partial [Candidatus Methylomirabilis lanthanidiphila]